MSSAEYVTIGKHSNENWIMSMAETIRATELNFSRLHCLDTTQMLFLVEERTVTVINFLKQLKRHLASTAKATPNNVTGRTVERQKCLKKKKKNILYIIFICSKTHTQYKSEITIHNNYMFMNRSVRRWTTLTAALW